MHTVTPHRRQDGTQKPNLELYQHFETLGIEFAYLTQTLILRDERDEAADLSELTTSPR
jgi:hypothetical protein